jgi:Fe-S-cluster containining protein
MRCARCGECCKGTMMELSEEDILRLIGLGFRREDICVIGEDGLARLRNIDGKCVFLSKDFKSCTVYENRPLGCEIYPVNCDQEGDIFVDEFCKARNTVSKSELRLKGATIKPHLETIDDEARGRKLRPK